MLDTTKALNRSRIVAHDLILLRRQIVAELKAESWSGALALLEKWCESERSDARAWFNRGYCLARLGRFGEALAVLDQCLRVDEGFEKAEVLRRQVAERLRRMPDSGRPPDGGSHATQRIADVATEPPDREEAGATMPSSADGMFWEEGSVVAGRYEVREVARGGMGVVYIAFDRELGRLLAIKTPLPGVLASAEGRARFFREAEAWVALGAHPNICTAFFVQEIAGLPRLFIDYVDGGDLGAWIGQGRIEGLGQRLDIAIQVAAGMGYTHTFEWTDDSGQACRGLLHRDLKPANVMMTLEGVARLTDFGLVRTVEGRSDAGEDRGVAFADGVPDLRRELAGVGGGGDSAASWRTVTEAGGVVGTPPYMAPELWQPRYRATAAADIYAYGCLLYELFCGRRPFVVAGKLDGPERDSLLARWLNMHVTVDPPDPTILLPGLDRELCDLMMECIAKAEGDRPASFVEIVTRLKGTYERLEGRPYPREEPGHSALLADSLNNRAVTFMTLGQTSRAAAGWADAMAAEPHHLEATFNLALHEWRTEGLTDAEVLRRLSEVRRDRAESWRDLHLLGRLHRYLGDPAAACSVLERAVGAAGGRQQVARDLGLALVSSAFKADERALSARAVDVLTPLAVERDCELVTLLALVAALRHQGQAAEAEEAWQRARRQVRDLSPEPEAALSDFLPGLEVRRSLRLPGPVEAIAMVSAGRVLVRCRDGVLVMWDLPGAASVATLRVPGEATRGSSMAVLDGGERAIVSVRGEPLAVWEVATGRVLRRFRTHPGHVTALALGPDEECLVTGGSDRKLRVWDVSSGECRHAIDGHEAFVSSVAVHPAGSLAVSGSGDSTVRVWDLDAGKCRTTLRGHTAQINAVAISPDGGLVLSASDDGTTRVWALADGEPRHTFRGHGGRVSSVVVTADGRMTLSAGDDLTVRCWSLEDGSVRQVLRLDHPVRGVATDPASGSVVVGNGSRLDVIDLSTVGRQRPPYALADPETARELEERDHSYRRTLDFARGLVDSGEIEAALVPLREARSLPGYGQRAEILDLWGRVLAFLPKAGLAGAMETRAFTGHDGSITACAFSPEGARVASAGADGTVRLWDLASGAQVECLGDRETAISSLAIAPDGETLLAAGRDGVIRRWGGARTAPVDDFTGHVGGVNVVAIDPGGGAAYSAGDDGTIRRWALAGGATCEIVGHHDDAVSAIAVSADGRFLVSGGWDQHVVLWDLAENAALQHCEGHEAAVTAVAVSPDCRCLASASEDGTVRLWDTDGGRCLRVFAGRQGAVNAVTFTPDARFVLAGGRDRFVRVWNVRTGACIRSVEGHTAAVNAVTCSSDGRHLLSAGADATLRLWFLDWEPGAAEADGWDERARPFIELFVRSRLAEENGAGTGAVAGNELGLLMDELANRGYGWLEPRRVRAEVDALVRGWLERETSAERRLRERAHREARRRKAEPIRKVASDLGRNLGVKLAAVVVAAIVGVVGLMSMRSPPDEVVRFNNTLRVELADTLEEVGKDLRAQGRARAYQEQTVQVITDPAEICGRAELGDYLDVVLYPEQHTAAALDPRLESEDAEFRRLYVRSVVCLGHLQEVALVEPLLRGAGAGMHPLRQLDVLRVIVTMGDRAMPVLERVLAGGDEEARHTAAAALVYLGSETALAVLADAIRGEDSLQLEAAGFVLRELIVSGALSEGEAYEAVRRMSQSIDPRTRRNAALALEMFELSEPIEELLDRADADEDDAVREAAEVTRERLRAARAREVLGSSLAEPSS